MLNCRNVLSRGQCVIVDQAWGLFEHSANWISPEPSFYFCAISWPQMQWFSKTKQTLNQVASSQVIFQHLTVLPTCLGASSASIPQRCCQKAEKAANSFQVFKAGDPMFSLTCDEQNLRRVINFSVANFLKLRLFHPRRATVNKTLYGTRWGGGSIFTEQCTPVTLSGLH